MNKETLITFHESLKKRGTWLVHVKSPTGSGFLRQGFAWKTLRGAENAAKAAYPNALQSPRS